MLPISFAKTVAVTGAALGIASSSAFAAHTDEFLHQLQMTDGYADYAHQKDAPAAAGVKGRTGPAGREAGQDRGLACLLMELKKSDGEQPSADDSAACMSAGTGAKGREGLHRHEAPAAAARPWK